MTNGPANAVGSGPTPEHPAAAPFLAPLDWALMLAFMALGLGLRLLYFSGFGLGDDFIFRNEVNTILVGRTVLPDNQAYRFAWWFPTALSCRLFGLTELGLILPFPLTATLGAALLFVLAKTLYGRTGAVLAATLLLFHPLDFAWSTMFTNDLMVSVLSAATILFVLWALEHDDRVWRRRCWTAAGVTLWLTYHAKISAVFLVPAIALIALTRRTRLTRDVLCLVLTAALLGATSLLVAYVFTGDPLFAYHAELSFQGLTGPQAVGRRVTADVFWYYPRLLFQRDTLGDLLYSGQPHLLVVLAVLAPLLRLRSSGVIFWWLACVFLGMQFNFQRVEGVWISGFRNIRHVHVLVYPLILLLVGYLVTLRARARRLTDLLVVALVVFSAWQAVATASKTRIAFADRRAACRFLDTLPRQTIYADEGLFVYCGAMTLAGEPLRMRQLHPNPEPRTAEIATLATGYLVTGGAREPYYGCPHCIPRAHELPAGRWRELYAVPGPPEPSVWRAEPLRIWEAIRSPPG